MATAKQPKVILFDIGGVVVVSPFQAILDYELSLGIPPGWINYSISKTAPDGFWHKLERGDIPMDDAYFEGFNKDIHDLTRWEAFYRLQQSKNPRLPEDVPPLPKLDGRRLFNDMMTSSTSPDPWMFPALKKLQESGKFIIAAVSNTVIFPPGHPLHEEDYFSGPVRRIFDVFVSSAHVGLRKPDSKMYEFTLNAVNKFAMTHAKEQKGLDLGDGVNPEDIVFLDDIGENLKAAKKLGFRTIKVNLGRAFEAVDELERVTGLKLAGEHPRIPIKPNYGNTKAKI
ncbi:HAD-like domain-containing protein [Pseudomassariella vexata]|uniref:HAD-like domain-containing protein n=1 Tax=Pseudomassariella vexata TaxID=1141098 RepID=A0A1Y2EAU0_9PEZI|nr:HAD-like domain-containing protein [Pseudomassariella vexata]ORY68688.1 HAD-like domain-containing protein [Pseudomassariella vexata]